MKDKRSEVKGQKTTEAKHIKLSDYRQGGLFESLSRLCHIRWRIAALRVYVQ